MDWTQKDLSSYIYIDDIFRTKNLLFLKFNFNKYFTWKRLSPEMIQLPGQNEYTQWYNTKAVLGVYDKRSENLILSKPNSTNNHL